MSVAVRMILGFAVAPLATPIALSLLIVGFYSFQRSLHQAGEALVAFSIYGTAYAYFALVLAVPGALILRRQRRVTATAHTVLGALVGFVPLVLLFGYGGWHNSGGLAQAALAQAGLFGGLGALSGASSGWLFWAVVYRASSAT